MNGIFLLEQNETTIFTISLLLLFQSQDRVGHKIIWKIVASLNWWNTLLSTRGDYVNLL